MILITYFVQGFILSCFDLIYIKKVSIFMSFSHGTLKVTPLKNNGKIIVEKLPTGVLITAIKEIAEIIRKYVL